MNPNISIYKSCLDKNGEICPVLDFLKMIKNGEWEKPILKIRTAVAEGQTTESKKLKRKLPCVTFSGHFSHRNGKSLITHSGLMVADLDKIESDIRKIRLNLIKSPYLFAIFTSPSGNGLKPVFRVSSNQLTHSKNFNQVQEHVRELSGLSIDVSGKDLNRLCFASFDPETLINPDALEMPHIARSEDENTAKPLFDVTQTLQTIQTIQTIQTKQTQQDKLVAVWWGDCVPTGASQTNTLLFRLARKSLDVEQQLGRSLTPAELKHAVDSLLRATPPEFLTKSTIDYFEEFCRIRSYTKFPLSQTMLTEIWNIAGRNVPEDAVFENPKVNHLAAFCYQLAKRTNNSFFLSVHNAAKLLEVDPTQASRWLKTMQGAGLLEIAQPHDMAKRLAAVYRWKGKL